MNAATYKWIPEACPGQAGPVGGLAGGIGGFGGYMLPLVIGVIISKGTHLYAKSLFLFTGAENLSIFPIILNTNL